MGQANVSWGLIANFFVYGGSLALIFAFVANTNLSISWYWVNVKVEPGSQCTMGAYVSPNFLCHGASAITWILTPGLVEETFKGIWLFVRLRAKVEEIPSVCLFGLCPTGRGGIAQW